MTKSLSYSQLSIANKISLLLVAGGLSITLSIGLIYAYFAVHTLSNELNQSTINTATLIGERNIAAIRFKDNDLAQKNIAAAMEEPSFKAICLYNATGSLFVYGGNDLFLCPAIDKSSNGLSKEIFEIKYNNILLLKDIFDSGEKIGTIFIKRERSVVHDLLIKQLRALGIICMICIGMAFFVSKIIEKLIAKPLINLTENANLMVMGSNSIIPTQFQFYKGQDEVGRLAEVFNKVFHAMQERLNEMGKKNAELIVAQNQNFEKMKSLSDEYMECVDSFLVYSELVMGNSFGPKIQNYLPYQFDVLDALTNYHVRLESHARIAKICGNSVSHERTEIELSQYIRAFVFRLKKAMPFAVIQHNTYQSIILMVYKDAWDEIFNILCNFLETLSGILEFNNILNMNYDEKTSQLVISCAEKINVREVGSLSSSNDNHPLPHFNFTDSMDEKCNVSYIKNTIDDPEAAEHFIKEGSYQRDDIKYILDTVRYIANANQITTKHSFESKTFSLTFTLDKCKNFMRINSNEMAV